MSKSMRLSSAKGQSIKGALVIVDDDPDDSAHQLILTKTEKSFFLMKNCLVKSFEVYLLSVVQWAKEKEEK